MLREGKNIFLARHFSALPRLLARRGHGFHTRPLFTIIIIVPLIDFSLCDVFKFKKIYEKSPPRMNLKNKLCRSAARLGRGFQTRPTGSTTGEVSLRGISTKEPQVSRKPRNLNLIEFLEKVFTRC